MTQQYLSLDCPHLRLETPVDGMTKAIVENAHARAELYLHGAHITSFKPKGQEELLWLSPNAIFSREKAIRGGIPLCWPWFGAHRYDSTKPAHGFARVSQWQLGSAKALVDGTTELILTLNESEHTLAFWPFKFELAYRIVVGKQLEIGLTVTNTNDCDIELSAALHSYFNVGDIDKTVISGLDGVSFYDKVDGNAHKQQSGDIKFGEEVDRVYCQTEHDCVITDALLNRCISVSKSGSDSTIVWNPWCDKSQSMKDMTDDGYKHMLCIEAGHTGGLVVKPAEQHQLTQVICCE